MIAIKEMHPPQHVPYFGLPLKYKSPGVENMSKNVESEFIFFFAETFENFRGVNTHILKLKRTLPRYIRGVLRLMGGSDIGFSYTKNFTIKK